MNISHLTDQELVRVVCSRMDGTTVARFFDDWSSASRAVDALHGVKFRDDKNTASVGRLNSR